MAGRPDGAPTLVILVVDADSGDPPYEQLRSQVLTAVLSGRLPEGSRLPPIRQLSGDLGIAPGTVARAYRELEADGVVSSRGRRGTFTRSPAELPLPAEQDERLRTAAADFALIAGRLGVGAARAVVEVRTALSELQVAEEPRAR